MNVTAKVLAVFLAASMMMLAGNIDGKWRSEREVGDTDGKTYNHVSIITLKSDGDSLTGTVVWTSEAPWMRTLNGKSFDIKDGKIDGDKFSFKIVHESDTGDRTSIYQGAVTGSDMKGVVKFRGIGETWKFDAKKSE